jgi:hypothetical protein
MRRGRLSLLLAAVLLALFLPSRAGAADFVNGDFESGNLNGWHVHRVTEAGNWFAYEGTDAPIGSRRKPPAAPAAPVQAPPQGSFAAVTDEANPDTLILYQDVTVGAGASRLSLLAYYDSYKPIAVPTPDTLSVDGGALGGQPNQQFRIDVMRPGAPLESLDPADVLLTVFQTRRKAPVSMQPTRLTADLSPFAGQTVRLRIANAMHEEVFNAGVDAVSLSGGSASSAGPPNRLGLGKAKANRRRGTVTLPVRIPGPGVLIAKGKGVRAVHLKVAVAGTVLLPLRLTPSGRLRLEHRHRLRVRMTVSFSASGGGREAISAPVTFRLAQAPKHRH